MLEYLQDFDRLDWPDFLRNISEGLLKQPREDIP